MEKVSMFCHVTPKQVIGVHNVSSTYHVPLLLRDQGLLNYLNKRLDLSSIKIPAQMKQVGDQLMSRWGALTLGQERLFDSVSIVLVGKYTTLEDSYMSVVKALEHAAMRCGRKLILHVGSQKVYNSKLMFSGSTPPTSSQRQRPVILSNTTMLGGRSVRQSRSRIIETMSLTLTPGVSSFPEDSDTEGLRV